MDRFNPRGMSRDDWVKDNSTTVIDYHHRPQHSQSRAPSSWADSRNDKSKTNYDDLVKLQLQMLSKTNQPSAVPPPPMIDKNTKPLTSYGRKAATSQEGSDFNKKYNPYMEDNMEDMEISDDEYSSRNTTKQAAAKPVEKPKLDKFSAIREKLEVKSGIGFFKGLILFVPPFKDLTNSYKGSPAMKMLYASFEFSFKMPVTIETKPKDNTTNAMESTVLFRDNIISVGSGPNAHVEASVRALELLGETCYTIQAKDDYFVKCKLVNAENMKTLNLKRWEAVSQKYPKLVEITNASHIQKTFALFLDHHTSTAQFEDMVCCNLTRQDVNNIKSVVEFFQLTMLPCSISTNMSKKQTPCVVSIHKYSSARKLLDILLESGGHNDKFSLFPPDTFRDFYKLHPSHWDPALKKTTGKKIDELKTTLDDDELQAVILKPYENIISNLFEKHKSLLTVKSSEEDSSFRKAGDDFMKETLKIDMASSKNVAPVERMTLLLKYMEQLQEYGSRVLASGRQEQIKIYHNAIDNLRKDLEACRKDIEKDQKDKSLEKGTEKTHSHTSRSPPPRRRSPPPKKMPPPKRSRSPAKRMYHRAPKNRSTSPKRRPRSRSPIPRSRSPIPRSRSPIPRSRLPRPRSRSPRPRSRSPNQTGRPLPRRRARETFRASPPRKPRSPFRKDPSPLGRPRSPRPMPRGQASISLEEHNFVSIFNDQFRRYVEILRRFRIEIEDTPVEKRGGLKDKLIKCQEQLDKFHKEALKNSSELGGYLDEMDIYKYELAEQADLIAGKPLANDLRRDITSFSWMNEPSFPSPAQTSYPLPTVRPQYGTGPAFSTSYPMQHTRPQYSANAGFQPPMGFIDPNYKPPY